MELPDVGEVDEAVEGEALVFWGFEGLVLLLVAWLYVCLLH